MTSPCDAWVSRPAAARRMRASVPHGPWQAPRHGAVREESSGRAAIAVHDPSMSDDACALENLEPAARLQRRVRDVRFVDEFGRCLHQNPGRARAFRAGDERNTEHRWIGRNAKMWPIPLMIEMGTEAAPTLFRREEHDFQFDGGHGVSVGPASAPSRGCGVGLQICAMRFRTTCRRCIVHPLGGRRTCRGHRSGRWARRRWDRVRSVAD